MDRRTDIVTYRVACTRLKNNNKKKNKNDQPSTNAETEKQSPFNELPFQCVDLANEDEQKSYVCIPYIPEIGPQLRRILKKSNITTTFTSAPKLKDILCSNNKTQPHPHQKKGIYKYTCTCSNTATYIGQTNRTFKLRWDEHARAIQNKNWHHSGITQHYENCPHQFNKENFQPIHNMQGKKRRKLAYDTKIREAFEIRRHGCGPGKGLNEDMGSYIRTDIWDPVLASI